jgi:hypothetical protein
MSGGDAKSILAAAGLCLALVFGAAGAVAQDDREHALVLKMGAAGEWASHERANFGGTFAVEKALIENWLEIEAGLTSLSTTGRTELSGDIIFKKPFRISPTFEFMIGVGPSISRTLNGEDQSTIVSAAFTLDFMFWPTPNRSTDMPRRRLAIACGQHPHIAGHGRKSRYGMAPVIRS